MTHLFVIGAGHVGLVTAIGFARLGHQVTVADIDAGRIAGLQAGTAPIYEPGLEEAIRDHADRLAFTTDRQPPADVRHSFVAVSTPTGPDGPLSLEHVEAAVRDLHARVGADHVIVIRSTLPMAGPDALLAIRASAPAGNGPVVTLPELQVTAKGVNADTQQVVNGTAKVTAEQVEGEATVAYATLETLIDYSRYNLTDVKFAESNGALHATGTATISGVKVPITATAEVAVKDGQFTIALRDATAAKLPVPAVVKNYLGNLAQQAAVARLPKLPFGLTLDSASVQPNGLAIAATGTNVPLIG